MSGAGFYIGCSHSELNSNLCRWLDYALYNLIIKALQELSGTRDNSYYVNSSIFRSKSQQTNERHSVTHL